MVVSRDRIWYHVDSYRLGAALPKSFPYPAAGSFPGYITGTGLGQTLYRSSRQPRKPREA
jgi:hypothetical protein